jgi:16S rRNA (guanine527-N7)-methyltransferase
VPDDPSALKDLLPVSRETIGRLETFLALIRKWQKAENLVSAKTLPDIWQRHVADSAQLVALFPDRPWRVRPPVGLRQRRGTGHPV